MKKMQSLGKALTKNEQKNVLGGKLTARQSNCYCFDGSILHACGTNCADARTYCTTFNICGNNGGLEAVGITCTACV